MSEDKKPSWVPEERSIDLSESAILETVVPTDSDIDLQELFQSWDREFTAEQSSIVPFIEQRQFLLLGICAICPQQTVKNLSLY
jgi:hypothetical protein